MTITVKFRYVDDAAAAGDHGARALLLPKRMTGGAAGFDLVAAHDIAIYPGDILSVSTGIALEIPPGFEGQVRPRSGLAARDGITVLNAPGTIDSDYRGEVRVLLVHHGEEYVLLQRGTRIAQLVICPVPQVDLVEVDELSETERGNGGFGSTGR